MHPTGTLEAFIHSLASPLRTPRPYLPGRRCRLYSSGGSRSCSSWAAAFFFGLVCSTLGFAATAVAIFATPSGIALAVTALLFWGGAARASALQSIRRAARQ